MVENSILGIIFEYKNLVKDSEQRVLHNSYTASSWSTNTNKNKDIKDKDIMDKEDNTYDSVKS